MYTALHCSAVNDGSCSPWVMCSCSVVRGNQIRDRYVHNIYACKNIGYICLHFAEQTEEDPSMCICLVMFRCSVMLAVM